MEREAIRKKSITVTIVIFQANNLRRIPSLLLEKLYWNE